MRFGISVSRTGIEILVFDQDVPVYTRHLEAPRRHYDDLLRAIAQAVQEAEAAVGRATSVGVAIPGTHVVKTGLIKNANITELVGRPLSHDLSSKLQRPIRLANDANCFTLAEATDGAASGSSTVFGAILDHGCGGGLVVHGRLVEGRNGLTGEWGHNHLPYSKAMDLPELACYCGRHGCIETYASAPGFTHDYFIATGRHASPNDIAQAALAGELEAIAACERLEDRLARALANVINIIDPDCIVLGGQLSHLQRLYEHVPRLWQQYTFGGQVETRLTPAKFGEGSTVRGATRLWGAGD